MYPERQLPGCSLQCLVAGWIQMNPLADSDEMEDRHRCHVPALVRAKLLLFEQISKRILCSNTRWWDGMVISVLCSFIIVFKLLSLSLSLLLFPPYLGYCVTNGSEHSSCTSWLALGRYIYVYLGNVKHLSFIHNFLYIIII